MSEELKKACTRETKSDFLTQRQNERLTRLEVYEDEFFEIFGKPLHIYCDYLAGFNSVAFWDDVLLPCPDGISYRSWTREHFGDRAAFLVLELINCTTGKTQ